MKEVSKTPSNSDYDDIKAIVGAENILEYAIRNNEVIRLKYDDTKLTAAKKTEATTWCTSKGLA